MHLLVIYTWGYETQRYFEFEINTELYTTTVSLIFLSEPPFSSLLFPSAFQEFEHLSGLERSDQCGCKQRRLRGRRTGGRKRENKPPSLLLLLFTSPWPHLALYTATYCCSVQRSGSHVTPGVKNIPLMSGWNERSLEQRKPDDPVVPFSWFKGGKKSLSLVL